MSKLPLHEARPLTPVLLAGGSGTRLWPLSRETMPKQFQALVGDLSPFQQTLLRVGDSRYFAQPVVVTTEDLRPIAEAQAEAVGIDLAGLVVEPAGRNTAPAILAAAIHQLNDKGNANLLVLPSDHVIVGATAFEQAVMQAAMAASRTNMFVTFGVEPIRPETGYGYIRRSTAMIAPEVFLIDAFIEKPSRDGAERLLAKGDVYWNSGMFCFPAQALADELGRLEPEMAAAVSESVTTGTRQGHVLRLEASAYARAHSTSIDYALMERTDLAAVVPLTAFWSDIGSWDAVWEMTPGRDASDNVCVGHSIVMNGANNYVRCERGVTAVVGLDDVVVVTMEDAVLVADRRDAQAIKPLVDRLRKDSEPSVRETSTVLRPWGSYKSVDRGPTHQVKHITVVPDGRLSLQYHHHRSEHWTVVAGTALVTLDDRVLTLQANESVYIPQGAVHRLENPGREPLHLIEVQCGAYLGEDDIVRVHDVYGRAESAPSVDDRASADTAG